MRFIDEATGSVWCTPLPFISLCILHIHPGWGLITKFRLYSIVTNDAAALICGWFDRELHNQSWQRIALHFQFLSSSQQPGYWLELKNSNSCHPRIVTYSWKTFILLHRANYSIFAKLVSCASWDFIFIIRCNVDRLRCKFCWCR